MKHFHHSILILCGIAILEIHAQKQSTFPHVTEFYFMRHGQTDQNIGIITDCFDVSLNAHGKQQAHSIKERIASLPIKTVCCSPLKRAQETAHIITAQLPVAALTIDHLTECAGNAWESMSMLKTHGHTHAPTSVQDFANQVRAGLETALSHPGPVLIVAHGGVYYTLCYLLNIDATDDWKVSNCVPVRFYVDGDGTWKLEKLS